MRLLIDDVLDLLRLRVKPLAAYQYVWWQPALLLTLMGAVSSGDTAELGGNIAGRIGFMVLFTWLQTLLFARFMGVWLRWGKGEVGGSLFGLVVVASGLQVVEPLTSWLPGDAARVADILLSLLGLVVLVNALSKVSQVSVTRTLVGVVLFAPLSLLLLATTLSFAKTAGWVELPPDMVEMMQQKGIASAPAPAAKK
ncbi:hypothetical protein [Chromobacterium violaceum]|uniref:Uncharacterized protein n=2 Tax=Chromobacterium violaceum TaxID=536 RepID=A0A1R0MFN4_CHRVL|nr:hypothetical protein [Chromobacterium violaceum]AAQ59601.1 hypothetical protein CV_1927 [Chromobacterium violaceum ATCC 12472]ATP28518.1 hypothetical protein CRN81_08955 [Chromobacterium violaceum]ATP32428.1 hypothetical protein CR207_08975 [Chromobacterium violaceum]KMN51038.1 hypothetical protein VK93_03635 [Chromobacterium violaceum]KMN86317.1 hypothetical protein VL02_11175 [Chromobacterium violaceum]